MNQPIENTERTAAMVFAKIGNTSALQKLVGEEEASRIINWCLKALSYRITQYSDWLVEENTDGVFAFFFSTNDAAIAALNIQTGISTGLKDYRDYLGVKVGISFGSAKLHQENGQYTKTVLHASALCDAAADGQILASLEFINHASKGWKERSSAVKLEQLGEYDPAVFKISWPGEND